MGPRVIEKIVRGPQKIFCKSLRTTGLALGIELIKQLDIIFSDILLKLANTYLTCYLIFLTISCKIFN